MSYAQVSLVGSGSPGASFPSSPRKITAETIAIDTTLHHRYPVLYKVSEKVTTESVDPHRVRDLLRSKSDTFEFLGEVTSIHRKKKEAFLATGDRVIYQHLILAQGVRPSYSHRDWEEFLPGIETLQEAIRIRSKVSQRFHKPIQPLAFAKHHFETPLRNKGSLRKNPLRRQTQSIQKLAPKGFSGGCRGIYSGSMKTFLVEI